MKKNKQDNSSDDDSFKAYCHYCRSTAGQISECAEKSVKAVYDCEKCNVNHCDQCSYEKEIDGKLAQFCLRCDGRIEKATQQGFYNHSWHCITTACTLTGYIERL